MILKVWVKSKFVLRQQRHYDWLKIIRNVTFSKYSFSENVLLLSISRNSLQTPSLDTKPLRNVTLSNSIISIKNLIRWKKERFRNIFDWPMLVILKITISLVTNKTPLYQCHPPYTKRVSSHRVLYLKFLCTYNTCIIYLHVIEACLKVAIARFYFHDSKSPSDVMKNIFNFISIYSWKQFPF